MADSTDEYEETVIDPSTDDTVAIGEPDVSEKARQTGESIKDLAKTAGKAVKAKVKETSRKVIDNSSEIHPRTLDARRDAEDISRLGVIAERPVKSFEDTMTAIDSYDYQDQQRLLTGFRTLLEEEINMIDSRMSMAKRLKTSDNP